MELYEIIFSFALDAIICAISALCILIIVYSIWTIYNYFINNDKNEGINHNSIVQNYSCELLCAGVLLILLIFSISAMTMAGMDLYETIEKYSIDGKSLQDKLKVVSRREKKLINDDKKKLKNRSKDIERKINQSIKKDINYGKSVEKYIKETMSESDAESRRRIVSNSEDSEDS